MATCLYKPKPCDICGRIIAVGEECEYIAETKTIRHYGCRPPESEPSHEAYVLAERLGFCKYDDDSIRNAAPDWVRGSRPLLLLPGEPGSDSTTRDTSPAHAEQASLFTVPVSDQVSINDTRGKQEY